MAGIGVTWQAPADSADLDFEFELWSGPDGAGLVPAVPVDGQAADPDDVTAAAGARRIYMGPDLSHDHHDAIHPNTYFYWVRTRTVQGNFSLFTYLGEFQAKQAPASGIIAPIGSNEIAPAAVIEAALDAPLAAKVNNDLPRKLDATTPPTADDDSAGTAGNGAFTEGSMWLDTVADEFYRCADASIGAAIWVLTTLTSDDLGTLAFKNVAAEADLSTALQDKINGKADKPTGVGRTSDAGGTTDLAGLRAEVVKLENDFDALLQALTT